MAQNQKKRRGPVTGSLPKEDDLPGFSLAEIFKDLRATRARLVRALRSFGLPLADIEDVIQTVLSELVSREGAFREATPGGVNAYLQRAARSRALDLRRDEARRRLRESWLATAATDQPIDPEHALIRR